ncbi:MAG: polysaccharide deacetylase family protein [Rhodopirellula sp.]|nr:polysaccharide deacetylase family protein [Rhodopirellula sp.]
MTGDVHHRSLRTNDQQFLADPGDSEVKIAVRFVRLAQQYNLKLTLYVTGKTVAEEWDDFRAIADAANVEIGGHTYAGLPQRPLKKLWYRLRGLRPPSHAGRHGSRRSQYRDIRRTVETIRRKTGRPVVAWRSHGLVRNEHTDGLLASCGIRLISDEIRAAESLPHRTAAGLLSHPINIVPDHDHLYHAHRDEEFVRSAQARGYGTDEFGGESYTADRWGRIVEEQLAAVEEAGGVATVLMHPICQFLADEFHTAERLFNTFSQYKNVWASELLELAEQRSW